jgi:hypothetical protein
MRLIVAGLLLLVSQVATAAPLVIDFIYPTVRADGSPQPSSGPGALASVRIEYGSCASPDLDAFGVKEGEVVVPYPQASVTVQVSAGIKCARAFLKDNLDIEGAASNLGRYFPAPGAVTLKTSERIAYELRKSGSGFKFVSVGSVSLGVQCGRRLVGAYYQIDGAKITKSLTGGVIAARCA